eukprot:13531947-Alexandrium_andersonii.AAC.1
MRALLGTVNCALSDVRAERQMSHVRLLGAWRGVGAVAVDRVFLESALQKVNQAIIAECLLPDVFGVEPWASLAPARAQALVDLSLWPHMLCSGTVKH